MGVGGEGRLGVGDKGSGVSVHLGGAGGRGGGVDGGRRPECGGREGLGGWEKEGKVNFTCTHSNKKLCLAKNYVTQHGPGFTTLSAFTSTSSTHMTHT